MDDTVLPNGVGWEGGVGMMMFMRRRRWRLTLDCYW
jgi:hypothetical protein